MTTSNSQSKIISRVLSRALKLWLRSQIQEIEGLQLEIISGDRDILSGYIPQVFLQCDQAIYQGIYLDEVAVCGENIRVNLGQILRGKPLTLLEPILVTGNISLTQASINHSILAPLLSAGLTDFVTMLLKGNSILEKQIICPKQVFLEKDKFIFKVDLKDSLGQINCLTIKSGLKLFNSQTLLFQPILLEINQGEPTTIEDLTIDLGPEVELKEINLIPAKLSCNGLIKVMP